MSNKIKQSLNKQPKEFELTNYQFDFLNSSDNLRQAALQVAKGMQLLTSQYLKVLATENFGYAPEDDLEFGIDLKDESHILYIKVLAKE